MCALCVFVYIQRMYVCLLFVHFWLLSLYCNITSLLHRDGRNVNFALTLVIVILNLQKVKIVSYFIIIVIVISEQTITMVKTGYISSICFFKMKYSKIIQCKLPCWHLHYKHILLLEFSCYCRKIHILVLFVKCTAHVHNILLAVNFLWSVQCVQLFS